MYIQCICIVSYNFINGKIEHFWCTFKGVVNELKIRKARVKGNLSPLSADEFSGGV